MKLTYFAACLALGSTLYPSVQGLMLPALIPGCRGATIVLCLRSRNLGEKTLELRHRLDPAARVVGQKNENFALQRPTMLHAEVHASRREQIMSGLREKLGDRDSSVPHETLSLVIGKPHHNSSRCAGVCA